jgi:hypothetical protein
MWNAGQTLFARLVSKIFEDILYLPDDIFAISLQRKGANTLKTGKRNDTIHINLSKNNCEFVRSRT